MCYPQILILLSPWQVNSLNPDMSNVDAYIAASFSEPDNDGEYPDCCKLPFM